MMLRMGRKATGSKRWNSRLGHWEAVVTLLDGSRAYVPMKDIPHEDEERATRTARLISDRLRDGGAVRANTAETVIEWFARWSASRKRSGIKSLDKNESHFRTWIAPKLGTLPIATIDKTTLERFVMFLDASVRAERTSWKNAQNVWGTVTIMMKDAASSKDLAIRVREDNPARDVKGPDRGDERAGPYLFPSEFLALMRCSAISLRRRRMYALATYLYLRGSELEGLLCGAVDLTHGIVSIHVTKRSRLSGSTKSGVVRLVEIEPTIRPLLEMLVDPDEPELRVTWTNHHSERAWQLRLDCQAAALKREALYVDDHARRPLVFHDLRATGITWRAVRGDAAERIKAAAGHTEWETTQGYVREALAVPTAMFGQPFPELPREVWDESWNRGSHSLATSRNDYASGRPQGESKELEQRGRVVSIRSISRRRGAPTASRHGLGGQCRPPGGDPRSPGGSVGAS